MVRFLQVEAEGFGSLCLSTTFQFEAGLYLIKGANGAGKTTLFNALAWGLYGQPLKDITASQVPTLKAYRTSSWQGTREVVQFEAQGYAWEVVRHIKYTGLTYEIKGNDTLMILRDG